MIIIGHPLRGGQGGADGADGATNGAPTTPIIQLWPGDATTEDALYVVVAGGAEDPDGDEVTILYVWSRDGEVQPAWTEDLVPPSATTKGERWSVEVSATDGSNVSAGVVAEVIIANAPPEDPEVELRPATPAPGEALECALRSPSVDPDGDPVIYTVTWQVDGVDFGGAIDGALPGDTVPVRTTQDGEAWTCTITAADAEGDRGVGEDSVVVDIPCGSGLESFSAGGLGFVELCPTTFDMGCTPGQVDCGPDESPVRPVTLTYGYFLSHTEVTQGAFSSLMGYNPAEYEGCGEACPVESLTWHQGAAFANAVSAAEGLEQCYSCRGSGASVGCSVIVEPAECAGYRLPTEAEWEAAARCGQDLPYAGSDEVALVGWTDRAETPGTFEVGLLADNPCGLADMTGNVWEMTHDWYDSAAYASGAVSDPTGPATGDDKVVRGGSWASEAYRSRVASRGYSADDAVYADLGLRLARTAP
ncbi:MAG: hypothetical protein RL071_1376 [Pseudomonadota bacterium]